jgi:Flagellar motor switch protein
MMIGVEKGQRILTLMDDREIKAVVPEIRGLTAVSREIQQGVWAEFADLGYAAGMKPAEALTVIRFLFNGSMIGGGSR